MRMRNAVQNGSMTSIISTAWTRRGVRVIP